jgi:hypothetical protein
MRASFAMPGAGQTLPTFLGCRAPGRRRIRLARPKLGGFPPPFVMLPPVSLEPPASSTSVMATGVRRWQSGAARVLASAVIPRRDQVPAAQPGNLDVGQLDTLPADPLGEDPSRESVQYPSRGDRAWRLRDGTGCGGRRRPPVPHSELERWPPRQLSPARPWGPRLPCPSPRSEHALRSSPPRVAVLRLCWQETVAYPSSSYAWGPTEIGTRAHDGRETRLSLHHRIGSSERPVSRSTRWIRSSSFCPLRGSSPSLPRLSLVAASAGRGERAVRIRALSPCRGPPSPACLKRRTLSPGSSVESPAGAPGRWSPRWDPSRARSGPAEPRAVEQRGRL